MNIGLSAESTIDLQPEYLKKWNINTIHFHVQKGSESSGFDNEYTTDELCKYTIASGELCHTSACNLEELKEHFDQLLKKYDYIIHFTIAGVLSSGYSNACIVADGNPRIAVIDSQVTSGGMAVQAIYARELIDNGYPFDAVVKKIIERRPFASCTFQLDRLDFLYKGGRCSRLAYYGTNLFSIKPEIVCNPEKGGEFGIGKKYRGKTKKCILKYVDDLLESHPNIDPNIGCLNISTMEDKSVISEVRAKMEKAGFKNILFNVASPTNAYHSGPNVLGVHFYYDGPHPVTPYKK